MHQVFDLDTGEEAGGLIIGDRLIRYKNDGPEEQ